MSIRSKYVSGTALGAVAGTAIGLSSTQLGWTITGGTLAAGVLAVLAVRALRRANETHAQINRDVLDLDPFNERLIPKYQPPTTYDLTVGWHDSTDEPTVYRGLTRTQLINRLAEHGITPKAIDVGGRHTFRGGKQLTWQPSTIDTTGEAR